MPTQTKPYTVVNPNQQLGAIRDTVEYIAGSLGMGSGDVNEAPVRSREILDPDRGFTGIKPAESETKITPIGTEGQTHISFKDHLLLQKTRARIEATEEDMIRLVENTPDPQLAKEGNYQENYGLVRTLYNFVWVATKRIAIALAGAKDQLPNPLGTLRERVGRKSAAKGAIGPQADLLRDFENRNISGNPG